MRTMLRAALVAVLLATLLVPAAPASAAVSYTYTLITDPVTVTRNSIDYEMTISATQSNEGGDSMTVTLSRTNDPAGAAKGTQSQLYTWDFVGNRFVPKQDLTTAALASSDEMGTYGNVKLTFDDNGGRGPLCDTTTDKRAPGKILAGQSSVTLNTGTTLFGKITNEPATATLYRTSGSCGTDGTDHDGCPPAGFSVSGYRSTTGNFMYMAAGRSAAAGPSYVMFSTSAQMPDTKTNAPGSVGRLVHAYVPQDNVTFVSNLSSATIKGAAGTFVSGTGTFTSNAAAYPPYTYPCGTNKEVVYSTRPGAVTGNLSGQPVIGSNIGLGQSLKASASRTSVRAI